ncbi:MAG: hypothetical protein LBD47_11895 [Treponema sp.]|nr:hypothetical protein [Treponema sp.]
MKRFILCVLLAFGIVAMVSAWGRERWGGGGPGPQQPPTEQVTVTGNLTIVQGALAVKSGDITYLVPGLLRYANFIDSLKDGAQVKLEGDATSTGQDAKIKVLRVSKLTIGGKDYDLARPRHDAPARTDYPGEPASPMMPWTRMHFNRRW